MLSYRKLAMRVLGRPLHTGGGNDSPRPASQRAAAFILTAALLTGAAFPAFAGTYHIEKGDIVISAGTEAGTNKVEQVGKDTVDNDKDTIITGTSNQNTVTIDTSKGNVDVTFGDLNIDASRGSEAAVSVTGSGDANIELNGDNELKSGRNRAGLEHNQTADSEGNVTSGKLTIQDDNDKAGSLTATGGEFAAGIGGGNANAGQVTITGGNITATGGYGSAGIGGGYGQISPNPNAGDGDVTISGGTIKAAGGTFGAGIGGGYIGDAHVTITGDATVEEVQGGEGAAGIGSGAYASIGEVEISGNAKIDNVTGGDYGAGIGGGFSSPWDGGSLTGNGKVTIKDNAVINNAQGGSLGAGIGGGYGGGYAGLGDVTIEGNTTVNATGGAGAAGIGGGVDAANDNDGNGNKITIRGDSSAYPNITATGGVSDVDEDTGEKIPGGAGIGSGLGDATAKITIEGKVTIVAKAGEGNVAIGDTNGEQVFTGLDGSITRYNSEGNDITLPTDPGYPVPADTSSSGGGSADASVQESVFPGLVVTDKDGQRISYTSTQSGNTLTVRVGRFTASLRISLAALRQLRADGIETINFQTILCSTTLSVDELLAMGGEDAEAVLTHRLTVSSLTVS